MGEVSLDSKANILDDDRKDKATFFFGAEVQTRLNGGWFECPTSKLVVDHSTPHATSLAGFIKSLFG